MIITFSISIVVGLYALLDAVSNADFVLQKLGFNEDVARFLGSPRGIQFVFVSSLLAFMVAIMYQLQKYENSYHHQLDEIAETNQEESNAKDKKAVSKSTPPKQNKERIVVNVEPEYLTSFFKEHTAVQAKKLAEAYIGKWIKITGKLNNVSPVTEKRMLIAINATAFTFVFAATENSKVIDHARTLKRGQVLVAFGKIMKIEHNGIFLTDIELTS